MKIKPMKLKLMQINPITPMQSLTTTTSPLMGTSQSRVLPDAGNQPDPTREQIDQFIKGKSRMIPDIVLSSLRNHPEDVLHGSQSLKLLLPQYSRNPQDWDILSPKEKERALALEAEIDRRAGCDIARTEYIPIPKVSAGPDDPTTSKHLYRIVTPAVEGDADIDVMDKPKQLKTQRHKGITHESLEYQYEKAKTRVQRQPMKAHKASSDIRDIENYFQSKGKKIPSNIKANPFQPNQMVLFFKPLGLKKERR